MLQGSCGALAMEALLAGAEQCLHALLVGAHCVHCWWLAEVKAGLMHVSQLSFP